jgi:hypothetical protein
MVGMMMIRKMMMKMMMKMMKVMIMSSHEELLGSRPNPDYEAFVDHWFLKDGNYLAIPIDAAGEWIYRRCRCNDHGSQSSVAARMRSLDSMGFKIRAPMSPSLIEDASGPDFEAHAVQASHASCHGALRTMVIATASSVDPLSSGVDRDGQVVAVLEEPVVHERFVVGIRPTPK